MYPVPPQNPLQESGPIPSLTLVQNSCELAQNGHTQVAISAVLSTQVLLWVPVVQWSFLKHHPAAQDLRQVSVFGVAT